jgi:hypothetical protein
VAAEAALGGALAALGEVEDREQVARHAGGQLDARVHLDRPASRGGCDGGVLVDLDHDAVVGDHHDVGCLARRHPDEIT